MAESLRKTGKNETDFQNIKEGKINTPELGDEGQFTRQKGVRYGQVSVQTDRIELDDGTQIAMRLSSGGITFAGSSSAVISFNDTVDGTSYGGIGYSSGFYMLAGTGEDLLLAGSEDINLITDGESKNISLQASESGSKVYLKGADTGEVDSSGVFFYNHDDTDWAEKTAVVSTSMGYRALYCMESPEVWFMDFCNAKKKAWWKFWTKCKWEVKVDPLFVEVTEKPYVIMPTLDKNMVQIWGKRKGMGKLRFEQKTEKEFIENNKFWATPKRNARKEK